MHKLRAGLLALLIVATSAACSTQTSPGNIITGPVFLEFAVGTLNDSAGTISLLATGTSTPGTFLNAVSSFRNNLGASAYQRPGNGFLTGPALSLAIGGLFSYGQAPFVNGVVGLPPAYVPASTAGGYATGFIFSGAPATPGTYAVSTVVVVNGQNQPHAAAATLPLSPTILTAEAPPVYASGGATGGGTFTVVVPSGVTETVVVISSGPNEVATVETKGTSAVVPAGTLTLGTAYTAFAIGADYPFVEAGPPANTSPTPTLTGTGAGGTSDLTVSSSAGFTQ
ncbi:MAG: hypothetical protein M3Z41_09000 [Candidatus Eremiobacteraeota bacterium]|nr:hypothetical protein [Candidatus Eremiobacteraeota bacterium]